MKILGLVGGTSWLSTVDYYKLINQGINDKLGGLNFAECIIYSFNFADIKRNNDLNDWESTFQMVLKACDHLKNCGAAGIVFCANTTHMVADRVAQEINIPIIHIATSTTNEILKAGIKKVALLGTRFTMERDFFKSKLTENGIQTLIPDEVDRRFLHATIFDELGKGIIKPKTKQRYITIISKLVDRGAEGIILGCTELPLIINERDLRIPMFDTTTLHSKAAVEFALS